MGMQREIVSRGAAGLYEQAIFAVALEGIFFGVISSLLSVLGAAIIISSALYVVMSGPANKADTVEPDRRK
jgi:drug/metabolite transporter (DMT)-like permease